MYVSRICIMGMVQSYTSTVFYSKGFDNVRFPSYNKMFYTYAFGISKSWF